MIAQRRTLHICFLLSIACLNSSVDGFSPSSRIVSKSVAKAPSKILGNPAQTRLSAAKGASAAAKQQQHVFVKRIFPAIAAVTSSIWSALADLSMLQKALFASVFVVGYWVGRTPPFWKAYRDVLEVPGRFFGPQAPILTGHAVSVSDGDTIRFYHTPLPFQKVPEKLKVSQVAMPIRICTIDTPETAKFGKSGQPFGQEAKEALKELLENKNIKIRMLQKDQYGRAVAQVMAGSQHADEYMLEKGLAEVYVGGGAVYGPKGLEKYIETQEKAKTKKLGIWSQANRESAAEYKKRTK